MHLHQHHQDAGLALIHDPLTLSGDVIFVHGLEGHRSRTWENKSGEFWLGWLEYHLPQARVWSYGYDAHISGPQDVFHFYAAEFLDKILKLLPVHNFSPNAVVVLILK